MAGSDPGAGNSNDSSSRSSTTSTTQTSNTDKRIVADGGATALSLDNSTLNMVDPGALRAGVDVINHGVDMISANQSLLTQAGLQLNNVYAKATSELIDHAFAQNQMALQAVSGVASIPLNANDQTRPMLIAGVIVVAVALIGLKGK